ncbi:MAG TPA: DUF4388 domain-containing protein [Thermoanaerobaculia bacterium]|nr:DUF4388 domain-containing protein [Thermoanaerobaculia bacterium]
MALAKPVLEGDLSAIQLPDLLSFVAMIRRTGKLIVRNLSLERTIHWKDGEILFATSNSHEHSLGQFLLRNGKISQQEYEESLRRLTPQSRHGKLLVQMGALSPTDLWWGVKNQGLEIIYSLFSWNQGGFAFYDAIEEIREERITMSTNTSSIIMEGIRRMDESARIREKITSLDMIFEKVQEAAPDFDDLDLNESEILLYGRIDGRRSIRDLIPTTELTEFEVLRIFFQLASARVIDVVPEDSSFRPVFLDVEDSPELLKIISTYNAMFGKLFETLQESVGAAPAHEFFTSALQSTESNELWHGVFFDQSGRFDENMLMANISELPFEERTSALDEGLNTLLSIQLFEVSQHLDSARKIDLFRYISDQKAQIEKVAG